jgi:hypothetical protein
MERYSPPLYLILVLLVLPAYAQTNQMVSQAATAVDSLPVKAVVVNPPEDAAGWKVGDIQVTFADGRMELFTHNERCGNPHVSSKGDVGWSVWNDVDMTMSRYFHTGETLKVRLRNGTTKNFQPNALFIEDWGFTNNDSAVVIKSMEHHGPYSFIKYDIATGKELGRQDGYRPYAELPDWAKPFAEDEK